MLRSIVSASGLLVLAGAATGCADASPPAPTGWTEVGPAEAPRARAILDAAALPEVDPAALGVPLQAVTGLAVSPHGLVVGGISPDEDAFWEAWAIPSDGGPPRRLAFVERLIAVDAGGAIWTAIASEDEAGADAFEIRLSPADGAPSAPLSADLPPGFLADLAVADGHGGRLLLGLETDTAGERRAGVFAVAADGTARRIAVDPRPEAILILNAALSAEALYMEVLYANDLPDRTDRRLTIVKVPVLAEPI
jgi:hypothetical protein